MPFRIKTEDKQERLLPPFGRVLMQVSDTISNTGIDLSTVELEFSYLQHLRPYRQRPEHWNNLGSPNARSTVQEEEVRTVIEGIMMEAGNDVIYGFTDGSCRGNPGPCGAGVYLFLPNQERADVK